MRGLEEDGDGRKRLGGGDWLWKARRNDVTMAGNRRRRRRDLDLCDITMDMVCVYLARDSDVAGGWSHRVQHGA